LHEVVIRSRAHFSSEEAMIAATHYPKLDTPSFQHQSLVQEIEEPVARFELCGLRLNEESLKFLRYWFNAHIQNDGLCYIVPG
jgi:hemerythrin